MSNSLKNVISDRSISWNHIPPIPIITLLLVEDTSSLWVQLCWFFFWYHRPLLPIPRSDLRIHWLLQNLWHSWHSLHQKDFYRVACTWTCQWLKFMKHQWDLRAKRKFEFYITNWHVPRTLWAGVQILVVFWQQIHIMKDETLPVIVGQVHCHFVANIEQHSPVEIAMTCLKIWVRLKRKLVFWTIIPAQ